MREKNKQWVLGKIKNFVNSEVATHKDMEHILFVFDCPVCKHKTVATSVKDPIYYKEGEVVYPTPFSNYNFPAPKDYQDRVAAYIDRTLCLACGKKFEKTEKVEWEEIEDKEKN